MRDSLGADNWNKPIQAAIKFLHSADRDFSRPAKALEDLEARLTTGRFHLAVLGQFKRGKSTFLNALLGEEILPTSVVPLTSIPTWIETGHVAQARCVFRDGSTQQTQPGQREEIPRFLSHYATEEGNPNNVLGVVKVSVQHPAPLLAHGVVLIDTPGIGSSHRHNTVATLQFLPECDAGVFLLSADPPITQSEIEFLEAVQQHVPRLFFVLNKVDYLEPVDREKALHFLKDVLKQHEAANDSTPIFSVSARFALRARAGNDPDGWKKSGMDLIENHLIEFLAREKREALQTAVRRKAQDIIADVLLHLRLSQRSLQLPLDDLQSRLAAFERWLVEMRREQTAMHDQLVGDQRRLHQSLQDQYEQIKIEAMEQLRASLDAKMIRLRAEAVESSALHEVLVSDLPVVFKKKFESTVSEFHDRLHDLLRQHEDRADRLIESVRKTATGLFDIPFDSTQDVREVEKEKMPYWLTHRWDHSFGPISPDLIDRLLPRSIRIKRLEQRLRNKIESLVVTNAGKLRETLAEQIDKAFSQFKRRLDQRIDLVVAATHGALKATFDKRQQLSSESEDETKSLEILISDLEKCRQNLLL